MWLVQVAIILLFTAFGLAAEREYYKKGQIGEYYEYDVEGTPRHRAFRNHEHHLSQGIKKPVKAMIKTGHYGHMGLKRGKTLLENYLKGTAQDEHQQQKLTKALSDWETALTANRQHKAPKSPPGLLYAPQEAWRLFKYSLYLAGFALPRSLKRGAKNIVVNTLGGEE